MVTPLMVPVIPDIRNTPGVPLGLAVNVPDPGYGVLKLNENTSADAERIPTIPSRTAQDMAKSSFFINDLANASKLFVHAKQKCSKGCRVRHMLGRKGCAPADTARVTS